jgi:hypothetical protein
MSAINRIVSTSRSIALLMVVVVIWTAGPATGQLPVIGWIEPVRIDPENLLLDAKIDTGADNSSLDVIDMTLLGKGADAARSVRFTVRNNRGEIRRLERPVTRYTRVKRKGAASVRRPVVSLDLCLAGRRITVPVNLQARANFKYRMLIGRSALRGRFLVDSGLVSSAEPICDE